MEVKEIQERSMLSAGLDILAEAASQNHAISCDSPACCSGAQNNEGTSVAGTSSPNVTDNNTCSPSSEDTSSVDPSQSDSFAKIMTNNGGNPQKDIPTPSDEHQYFVQTSAKTSKTL